MRKVKFSELCGLRNDIRDRLAVEKLKPFEYVVSVMDLSIFSLFLKKCFCNFYVLDGKGFVIWYRNRLLNIMSFKKGFGHHLLAFAEKRIGGDVVLFSSSSTEWFERQGYYVIEESKLFGNKMLKEVCENV